MIRQIALAVCLMFLLTSLAACGTSEENSKKSVTPVEKESESTGEEQEKQEAETETDSCQEKEQEEQESEEPAEEKGTVMIEEQMLIDQNGIKVTALEYVEDQFWGEGIKMLVENNSDHDITLGCTALIVNDYMINDLFVSDIAAGKKANETMYLSSMELEAAGIDSVGKIEVYFHAYDTASYEDIFNTDCVTIKTSEYENMDTEADDSGLELYNEGGIRIVGKTVDENSFWGTAILLYSENNSGRNVDISVEDLSVNGFMMSPMFSTTVYDGKRSIDDLTLFSSELEENGIESIEEVELKFHIYDSATYDTIADSEPITFSAK